MKELEKDTKQLMNEFGHQYKLYKVLKMKVSERYGGGKVNK